MSAQAMGWALDQELPARPKLVLVAIGNHADHTDGYCWLKAETIAAESSHSVRSVYRTLAALERNGYLRRQKRKGADGKQRANDYWILFNREAAPFEWRKGLTEHDEPEDEIEAEGDAEEHASADADPLDVDAPPEASEQPMSCGPGDSAGVETPPSEQPVSCGPTAIGVTAKESAEPSKIKPLEGLARGAPPRTYRPPPQPPPLPVGSTVEGAPAIIFVWEGTRHYDAWAKVMAKRRGLRTWSLTTMHEGRRGWFFPTLHPPPEALAEAGLATEDDLDHFAQAG